MHLLRSRSHGCQGLSVHCMVVSLQKAKCIAMWLMPALLAMRQWLLPHCYPLPPRTMMPTIEMAKSRRCCVRSHWNDKSMNQWTSQSMSQWIQASNEPVNQWAGESMNHWLEQWTNHRISGFVNQWVNKSMKQRIIESMNQWANEPMKQLQRQWINHRIND